jgi:hypothetical protein
MEEFTAFKASSFPEAVDWMLSTFAPVSFLAAEYKRICLLTQNSGESPREFSLRLRHSASRLGPLMDEAAVTILLEGLDSSDTICEAKTSGRLSKKRRKGYVKLTPPKAHSSKNRRSSPARGSTIQSVRDVDMLDLLRMFQRLVNETHFLPDAAFDGASKIHAFNEQWRGKNGYALRICCRLCPHAS